jgi:hypothetical protein
VPKVIFENEEFNGTALEAGEEALLQKQLFGFIAPHASFLEDLFKDNYLNIVAGLQVAKTELGAAPFRGMYAGDSELSMQLIRPAYVLRTTGATETAANDWTFTFTAGNDYWIGFGTDNTTAINVDKRACVIPLAVAWTQGGLPTVEEIYVQLGGTTYPVNVIRQGWWADNVNRIRVARIRPQIWRPKSRPLVQVRVLSASQQELVLVGIAFVMGDLARAQAPTTIQT